MVLFVIYYTRNIKYTLCTNGYCTGGRLNCFSYQAYTYISVYVHGMSLTHSANVLSCNCNMACCCYLRKRSIFGDSINTWMLSSNSMNTMIDSPIKVTIAPESIIVIEIIITTGKEYYVYSGTECIDISI